MASDYCTIKKDNERRYGTDIGRIGPMLLADRYDDRTHFIFELLQNAEDALARRPCRQGSRSVSFHLIDDALRVSHFGKLFDADDVRGICGIAESTKDLTAIGRFGIGFKSVYAFTNRPEIHSGDEDFAIESFVWPVAAPMLEHDRDETVILIPLKPSQRTDHEEIAAGLQRLGADALLFLRQIEEINWSVQGGRSGLYLRESKEMDAGVRRVTVIGQEQGKEEIEETWLVFSRPVTTDGGSAIGNAEIAFSVVKDDAKHETVQRVERSPLVVFFPTVLETHLGFLVQGPYRTTPSRDNVPRNDSWNQNLVRETASLLVEALRWLRDHDLLDTTALRCLPLDSAKFGEPAMFAPLFAVTKRALSSEPLLPRFDTGYVPAAHARLARTQELRELFAPSQLAPLYGEKHELPWLSGDITLDRTPELRRYLMQELSIAEVTPETIIPRLDKPFLQAQSDAWILDLYHFLNGQPALRRRLSELLLVRLEDGTHVAAHLNGQPQAFLPGAIKTGFPTVRASVCATETARDFLQSLGLTKPDPVDDVVRNVLPKYREDKVDVNEADYEADIRRILAAFATDSKQQREKLIAALQNATFVKAVNAGDGSKRVAKPGALYLATERLKELFSGVGEVLLVDDVYVCLRGEDIRELLEDCGAARYLKPIPVDPGFSWEQRLELRRQAGHEQTSGQNDRLEDWSLVGFDRLLAAIPTLSAESAAAKAKTLWEALGDVETRRGQSFFTGTYRWTHYGSYSRDYPSKLVRQLNETVWVPSASEQLERPEIVLFDTLGWKPNPFLQSKIRFKPPVIEALAKEAGIDPGVLDLLKKLGVTSEAELKTRLGITDEPKPTEEKSSPSDVDDALKKLLGDMPNPTPPIPDPAGAEPSGSNGGGSSGSGVRGGEGSSGSGGSATGDGPDAEARKAAGAGAGGHKRTSGSSGGRPFISYVGSHPYEDEPDPDSLDQQERIALEQHAIDLILKDEPQLLRTPVNNPGFDLVEHGDDRRPVRWVEVKAMTGTLQNRPVGLSRTQFESAQEHGDRYWLYIVEHAGADHARIVRIQDPVGKARTFTFDKGWLSVAQTNDPTGSNEEQADKE